MKRIPGSDPQRVEATVSAELDAQAFRAALLARYDRHRRELPWRDEPDPYRVWVSEVMLQQTRAATVIPYYERWIARFPTLDALAEAELPEVLKAWEGLGYYSRARNLHRAAMLVRERHGGSLPAEPDRLRELPGVGEYTAGAISSIAFGRAEPAIDGNVRRVLARVLDDPAPPGRALRNLARQLVDGPRPGDLNQALFDLGASVCTPRAPDCRACPVARHCLARARGTQLARPAPRTRRVLPETDAATAVVTNAAGGVLLVRRPADGLLGGLWELPWVEPRAGEPVEEAARRVAERESGGAVKWEGGLGTVVHTFSHRRIRYRAFAFSPERAAGGSPDAAERAPREERREPPAGAATRTMASPAPKIWASPAAQAALPLPRAQRRILGLRG